MFKADLLNLVVNAMFLIRVNVNSRLVPYIQSLMF